MDQQEFVAFRVKCGATVAQTRANIKAVWGQPTSKSWLCPFPIEADVPARELAYATARKLQDIQVAPNVWLLRFVGEL